jgi:hypothetical protein
MSSTQKERCTWAPASCITSVIAVAVDTPLALASISRCEVALMSTNRTP